MSESNRNVLSHVPPSPAPQHNSQQQPEIVYVPVPRVLIDFARKHLGKVKWAAVASTLSITITYGVMKRPDAPACGCEQHERGGEMQPPQNQPRTPRHAPKKTRVCPRREPVAGKKGTQLDASEAKNVSIQVYCGL